MINLLISPVMLLSISSIFNKIGDFFTSIPSAIGSAIVNAISNLVGKGLYYLIVKGLLSLVNVFYRIFSVFAGLQKVDYDGTKSYLLNVFFENSTITNIYWAMALVGMAMMFGFAIFAVVRKMFDIDDKHRLSISGILKNCFKSIFVILVLSLCVTGVINGTNVLMQSVTYIFDNAEIMGKTQTIEYTDSQYATMARVLNTIGNYSLNPSSDSRFNINSCFNEIRGDLYELRDEGVFDGHYETEDEDGNAVNNWMTVLQSIAESADLSYDLDMDIYNESVTNAITNAMETLQNNPNLEALREYTFPVYSVSSSDCVIDRALFLAGTTHAAKESSYNENASVTDALRGPFYSGERNMYSLSEVNSVFNIGVGSIDYVLIAIFAFFTLKFLFSAILQCASRIFILIGLYISAPPFIATLPWDDGEKFKQWTNAFIIQALNVFGVVIPMRLLITLMPIILSDKLTLFPDSAFLNIIAKMLLILGGLLAVNSFGSILSGILSGNAGIASAQSGGAINAAAGRMFGVGAAVAGRAALTGGKLAGGVARGVASGVGTLTGMTTVGRAVGSKLSSMGESISNTWEQLKEHGGLPGAFTGHLPKSNSAVGKASTPSSNAGKATSKADSTAAKVPPPLK